jgi:hypothetical protein
MLVQKPQIEIHVKNLLILFLFLFGLLPQTTFADSVYSRIYQSGDVISSQTFRRDLVGSNFNEYIGFKVNGTSYDTVNQVRLNMCNLEGEQYYAHVLDSDRNIISTSTLTNVPSCTGYDETSAFSSTYGIFNFDTVFDILDGYSVVVRNASTSSPSINLGTFYHLNSTSTPVNLRQCLQDNPLECSPLNTDKDVYVDIRYENDFTSNSFLEILDPTLNTTTPSSSVTVQLQGLLSSDDVATSVDKIRLDFQSLAFPEDSQETFILDTTQNLLFNTSTTTNLVREGGYLLVAYFTDENDLVFQWDSVTFNVSTTSLTLDLVPTLPVGFCDDSGFFESALCNTLVFLFYPSDAVLNRYSDLQRIFSSKVPFGYLTLLRNKFETHDIESSSAPILTVDFGTSTFSLGELDVWDLSAVNDNFDFTVITDWINRVIWVLFGLYIAVRVSQLASRV